MARILLVDDDINLLQMVKLMLERVGHSVEISNKGERGIQIAAEKQPELAIIDVMMPGLSGYDVVRRLRDDPRTARIPIIILTARSQPMDKQVALQAGANAFLSKPVTAQELTTRVDAVLRAGVNFRVNTGLLTEPVNLPPTGAAIPSTPPASRPATPPAPATPPPPSGHVPIGAEDISPKPASSPGATQPLTRLPVIAIVGLRGGTGSTTLAVNTAFMLAGRGRRVCLADLSTVSGHLQLHMHLNPTHNWGELLPMGPAPDPRAIAKLLTPHAPSGIQLLAAPPIPATRTLTAPAIQMVLRELSSEFNHVIVDLPTLNETTIATLTSARTSIIVMTDDPTSVQTTVQFLMTLQRMGEDPSRVRIVLNHIRAQRDVQPETIAKALQRPISLELPFEPSQPSAIRRGLPVVSTHPDSAYSAAVQQLLRQLAL